MSMFTFEVSTRAERAVRKYVPGAGRWSSALVPEDLRPGRRVGSILGALGFVVMATVVAPAVPGQVGELLGVLSLLGVVAVLPIFLSAGTLGETRFFRHGERSSGATSRRRRDSP